jgi:hypothetical protein
MRVTGIVAIVEPLSFSLDNSLSWAMTTSLQQKRSFHLTAQRPGANGQLTAILPILQPMRAKLGAQEVFLLMMRARFSSTFSPLIGEKYVVTDSAKHAIASLWTQSGSAESPRSYLLMSEALDLAEPTWAPLLQNYVAGVVKQLWHSEPINWTTHALNLASTGQFLSSREIIDSGASTGTLIIDNVVSIQPGTKPVPIRFRRWRGAGNLRATTPLDDASCSQTIGGGTSSGGDFGSGHSGGTDSWGGSVDGSGGTPSDTYSSGSGQNADKTNAHHNVTDR